MCRKEMSFSLIFKGNGKGGYEYLSDQPVEIEDKIHQIHRIS
jgi:hypothetical protein